MTRCLAGARRNGFALLTVLWVIVGATILMVQVSQTAREAIGTAGNRIGIRRAAWTAEGCVARLRASIEDRMTLAASADSAWSNLDASEAMLGTSPECAVRVEPVGTALDVNAASPEQLTILFTAAGMSPDAADSLRDAIADWRDADHDPRSNGAEAAWYRAQGQTPPRDSLFASREELRLVRGWTPRLDSLRLLDVEPGAILITRAPAEVLAALPGWNSGMVARIIEARRRGDMAGVALAASGNVEQPGQVMDGGRLVTTIPDAWLATVTATDAVSGARFGVQLRLARSGRRVAILRHRSVQW